MTDTKPLIIAVAPNGARHTKSTHPNLPLTPEELAITAVECLEAGARMFHLHVRDEQNQHSLSPQHYTPALEAIKKAVGEEMLIQITTEAAGIYQIEQQIRFMQALLPDCLSVALREFITNETQWEHFREFIASLSSKGCLLQYILYDINDFNLYKRLIESHVIPSFGHSLLLVLGRYSHTEPTVDILAQYQSILATNAPWMCCTFGINAHQILSEVVALGAHVRVGFENSFYLPDGRIAGSNADIVAQTRQSFCHLNRPLATIKQTKILLGYKA